MSCGYGALESLQDSFQSTERAAPPLSKTYKNKPKPIQNMAIKEGSLMTGKGQTSCKEEDPANYRPVRLTFGPEEIMRYFLLESIPKDINDKAANQEQLTQICQLTDQSDCQDSYVEEGCNTTQLH